MGTTATSQRRIDANRRNAALSTGPRTAEGKAKSRRNSLVHGLAGAGVVLFERETEALRVRAEECREALGPVDAFEGVLVETVAAESLRVERCRAEERLARDFRARRAEHCWEDERKAAIAREARSLAARPAETAMGLASSAPGCDWLIDRWKMLGYALDCNGGWTEAQQSLALDMLGIDPDLRELPSPLDDVDGPDGLAFRFELVENQLGRLMDRKESVLDAIEAEMREAAMQGLDVVADPTLTLIRRYETASLRRMRWAMDLLSQGKARASGQDKEPAEPASQPEARAERTQREGPNLADRGKFAAAMPATVGIQAGAEPLQDASPNGAGAGDTNLKPKSRNSRKLRQSNERRRMAAASLLSC
ncbi:hypothetical protein EP7_000005 [Isosphaeraceae bacterium EP7]